MPWPCQQPWFSFVARPLKPASDTAPDETENETVLWCHQKGLCVCVCVCVVLSSEGLCVCVRARAFVRGVYIGLYNVCSCVCVRACVVCGRVHVCAHARVRV